MTHPTHALQSAIVTALIADAPLTALLGGPRIYEKTPAEVNPPWVAFDVLTTRAADAVDLIGHLHRITLRCVSAQPGTQECSNIAERVRDVLLAAAMPLVDHHLVNLDVTDTAIERTGKQQHRVMVVTLRAMTQQQP